MLLSATRLKSQGGTLSTLVNACPKASILSAAILMTEPGWSMQQIDTLRRMWVEGASFSKIGIAVGKSKNAVAGKSHRLGLLKRGVEHLRRKAAENARERWGDRSKPKNKSFSFKRTSSKERKPPMFLRVVSVPGSRPVSLVERTGCCYPTSSDKPHLFCNQPKDRGDYCEFHFIVMYPKGKAV